ncbi:MAG: tetratricopeptide repeat protein [Terriglobales bacterium]
MLLIVRVVPVKTFIKYVTFCSLFALVLPALSQTFEIGGQSEPQPATPRAKSGQRGAAAGASSGIGWGNSIEVGRLTRAAEDAVKRGDAGVAADFSARALKLAPQNNHLWFLLGYTARLAGRSQASIDAYQQGLRNDPNSIEGLSGLAQTYMRTGRAEEAKKLLLQVLAVNPRRPVDLMMAGELFLQSGDSQRGIDLLQRSEALRPSSHTEVMLATAYMKSKQPERAKQLLDRAKSRGANADVFRAVANYYREQRDYDSAIKTLLELPKKTPDLLGELGYTYALAGRKEKAADAYVKAANAAPQQVKLQLSAAESLVRVGDFDGARKYLARAAAIEPSHYRLHAIRADMARAAKRTDEAIAEYKLALANIPAAGVAEGVLYPVQLRLNLAEQYRDFGDDNGSKQQIALAKAEIDKLDVQGASRPEFLRMRASVETAGDNLAAAEADLKQAQSLAPENLNITVQYAALLWRMKRPDEARRLYQSVLAKEPKNRYALESLGYLAREEADNQTAEEFFLRLRDAYPNDYVAYVALGDLYTALRQFQKAQANYERGYAFAPSNSLIIAGGANAAIEAKQIEVAKHWLDRATPAMQDDARVMKERERYLFHTGKYLESAQLGWKVIKKLPNDRDGSVYLAYDLYNLGRYDDVLELVRKYQLILPKEPNFPLLSGHVQKQTQLLSEAVDDYTRAIELDPNMVEAYINRGYVLNDLQNAEQAAQDFEHVLKSSPDNGVARLGLSFSYLQLHKAKLALDEAQQAQNLLGESGSTHLAMAGAYRQMRLLRPAEKEYRAAIKYAPSDVTLHLALADTLYHLHRYPDSLSALNEALALAPDDAAIYAKMAHAHAQMHNREDTLRYVLAAEQEDSDSSAILLDTGDALLTLGDRDAAMKRFERALEAPDANRVDARLLIAKLMQRNGQWGDARQQISLAFAESRIGEASPVTTDNLIQAANLFLAMYDFDLAQKFFLKAKEAGAADQVVNIGLANVYLAQGDPRRAEAQLAALGNSGDLTSDYDYTLAMANVYRERHDTARALTAFARANMLAGEDDAAQRGQDILAAEEGLQLNQKLSVLSDVYVHPIFEDATIYINDARLGGPGAPLNPPRSSIETLWTNAFRLHQGSLPTVSGFFQVRNARGEISVPSQFRVLDRNTYDYTFNGGLQPVLHLGSGSVTFNSGIQYTLRRDHRSPIDMDQNLFRQFVYISTSPFWNWISIKGTAMHESGPFTLQNLSSRDLVGRIEFTVGRPWGKTALLTGYSGRDLVFHPRQLEFYTTSAYVGLQRKFGKKLTAAVLGEYIRSWRVRDAGFGAGQIMRPAGQIEYRPNRNWEVNANFAWSRGQGFHAYDNMQSGFFISYMKPLRRRVSDGVGEVPVEYPLRFSVGLEQQHFYNFTGRSQAMFRPVVRLTLF